MRIFFAASLALGLALVVGGMQAKTTEAALAPGSFITITSPNGGETFNTGQVKKITWNSSSNIDKVILGYIACDSCLDWITTGTVANTGSYDWEVNVGNTTNTQYKISIIGYETGQGSVSDVSDANFTVYNHLTTPAYQICYTCLKTNKTSYVLGETPIVSITGATPNSLIYWEFYLDGYLEQEAGEDYANYTDANGNFTDSLGELTKEYVGNWELYILAGNTIAKTTYTVLPPAQANFIISIPNEMVATVGTPFSAPFLVSGGQAPYSWTLIETRPVTSALSLSKSGQFYYNGAKIATGKYEIILRVSDASGAQWTMNTYITLHADLNTINPPVPVPPVTSGRVGMNVRTSDGTVWFITNANCRSAYTSAGAFLSYGFNSRGSVVDAATQDLQLPVCSANNGFTLPREGRLLCSDRGSDKGTCYLISNGKKSGFTSATVFIGLGFSFLNTSFADVSWMATGSNVDNDQAAHVPGVLINNNGTIQLATPNGLASFPDMNVFNSWGYSLADVVSANQADKIKPQASILGIRTPGALNPY